MINLLKKILMRYFSFEKVYRWQCSTCGDVISAKEEPYCKLCMHVERKEVKMEIYKGE
tara:strand:+ start:1196 stop:1369 length:174 start_codon:yes stop_codon:yes gene_type:complete